MEDPESTTTTTTETTTATTTRDERGKGEANAEREQPANSPVLGHDTPDDPLESKEKVMGDAKQQALDNHAAAEREADKR